ncbi:MAG: hypothetical protein AMJ95_03350 [Omnitrophica WOR_2 bacterium SM23_72]|nr:MAG: hypothetical protein AMJ95_03350 [Omnitrophica WOR_2 bacterium SM23_72]
MIQNSAGNNMAILAIGGNEVFPVNQRHATGKKKCLPSQATQADQAAKDGDMAIRTLLLVQQFSN